jgi:hypothetical protein
MNIKAAFIFFAIVIGVGGFLGYKEIESLKEELKSAKSTNHNQKLVMERLQDYVQRLTQYFADKNHEHTNFAEENHSHYDYSETDHKHKYAEIYHSHGRYADEDDFEMLQINFRALESSFDLHQYSEDKHHRH